MRLPEAEGRQQQQRRPEGDQRAELEALQRTLSGDGGPHRASQVADLAQELSAASRSRRRDATADAFMTAGAPRGGGCRARLQGDGAVRSAANDLVGILEVGCIA